MSSVYSGNEKPEKLVEPSIFFFLFTRFLTIRSEKRKRRKRKSTLLVLSRHCAHENSSPGFTWLPVFVVWRTLWDATGVCPWGSSELAPQALCLPEKTVKISAQFTAHCTSQMAKRCIFFFLCSEVNGSANTYKYASVTNEVFTAPALPIACV